MSFPGPVSPPALAVVTGANSGIGRATAVALGAAGFTVVGTVRRKASAAKLLAAAEKAGTSIDLVELDVADTESVRAGFAEIADRHGSPAVLVNNAGIAPVATVEECTAEVLHDTANVNVAGALRAIHCVLPAMRAAGRGCIVNVTSVAGRVAGVAQAPYTASKWALEGLSESLAHEVAPFGVRVAIVEPGVTRSAIFAKNTDAPNVTGAYGSQYARMFQFFAAGIPQATPAEEVGALIVGAVTTDEPRLRYVCSWAGPEMVAGRSTMSDEEWVAMGALDDDAYYEAFARRLGVELRS